MSRFDIDDEDAIELGRKVAEMAARVRKIDQMVPGARATWFFEVDDVRFKVAVVVDRETDVLKVDG